VAKPSEFFLGVIDLFAVFLPGGIAAALLAPRLGDALFGPLLAPLPGEVAAWAAFLAASYFLGHLVFMVGALLDPLYDFVRKRLVPADDQAAFVCTRRLRDTRLDVETREAINPFQWSRSVLMSRFPAAAADVHRLEADSKFFRSLLVVSLLGGLVFALEGKAVASGVAILLVVPCFLRYFERRLKSTTQAYRHMLSLQGEGLLGPGGPTHRH
jgi:hypothetical protein